MDACLRRAENAFSPLRIPLATRLTPAVLIVVLFISADRCLGQTFSASLTGAVTDPQGAAIPNASVELKNTATNDLRQTTTGTDGRYIFSQLLPGKYDLTAKADGFKTFLHRGVTLLASRAATLDFPLQIGAVTQSIEVSAQAALLDTQSANQSATLTQSLVTELPTPIHNPLALVLTQAGANVGVFGELNSTTDQIFSGFGLNGGRSMSSAILLDGASVTAADWGGLMVAPPTDSVQEMQIMSNTYDAKYGRSGGGVVSLISKSGSSSFHGEGFEFLRAENLDATSWGANRFVAVGCNTPTCNKRKKPEFKRHQFGGDIGGPIWRSKRLFFFGSYEALRQGTPGSSGVRRMPTDLERQGDFSATYNPNGTLQVLFNPFSTRPDPLNPGQFIRDPFDPTCVGVTFPNTCAGNKIPSSLIDPVGAKAVGLLPRPTGDGDAITHNNNFFKTGTGRVINDKFSTRFDWAHSDKHTLFGRWTQRIRQKDRQACYYCNGADVENSSSNPGFQATLNNTFTPSRTLVLSVLLSASRWVEEQISPALGKLTPASVGLDPKQYDAPLVPGFSIGGFAGIGPFFNQKVRSFPRYTNTLQVEATKEIGRHSVQFGWIGEPDYVNNVDRFSGNFSFGRGFTSGPVAATDSSSTGNALASLLLGTTSSGSTTFNADLASKLAYYGFYGQDTWRKTSRLTLIFGLRYELQPGATERYNRLANFNPNVNNPLGPQVGLPLKGGLQYAGAGRRSAWDTHYKNFAPRFGLAYKWTDKLVVRAGFGIFFVPASSLFTFDQPGEFAGFSTSTDMVTSVGGGGLIPQDLLRNPFPGGLTQPTGSSAGLLTFVGQSPFQAWLTGPHPTGYKESYSVDFQYEIKPGMVLDVGYLGYGARKLNFGNPSLNMNQLPSNLLSMGSALNQQVPNPFFGVIKSGFLSGPTVAQNRLLRPFPEFNAIQPSRSLPGATNNYRALSVRFTRQYSGGLSLISSYQWSKNMDDASEDQGWAIFTTQWRDFYNRKLEYSVSSHDVPQSFITSLVYELPFGQGKKWGSNLPAAANHVVGGWQVSSIVKFQSGFPIIVQGPGNLGAFGFGRQSPNLVSAGLARLPHRTPELWFNPCTLLLNFNLSNCVTSGTPIAWTLAAPFTIGNAPRFLSGVRTDYTRNVDFALAKNIRFTEQFRLQFRAEFFNLLNTPVFGGPNSVGNFATSSGFGQLLSTQNSSRAIQFALKLNF